MNFAKERESRIDAFRRKYQLRFSRYADTDARLASALDKCSEVASREFRLVKKEAETLDDIGRRLKKIFAISNTLILPDELSAKIYVKQKEARDNAKKEIKAIATKFYSHFEKMREDLSSRYKELRYFKLVLFGCTKAGKSTIREALTGGNGETIGKGGQSTTKRVVHYKWNGLHLYDTPGVDSSKDYDQGEAKSALIEMKNADLAVFVMMPAKIDGSVELKYLKDVIACGHDVLVLLNVKESISEYDIFKLEGKDKLISEDMQRDNIESIRSGVKVPSLPVLVIHAQAGYLANASVDSERALRFFSENKVSKNELKRISRLDEMKAHIESIILKEGLKLRVKGVWLKYIEALEFFTSDKEQAFNQSRKACEQAKEECLGIKKKIEAEVRDYRVKVANDLSREVYSIICVDSFVERCFKEEWDDKKLRTLWKRHLKECISSAAEKSLNKSVQRIKDYVVELKTRLDLITLQLGAIECGADGVDWRKVLLLGSGIMDGIAIGLGFWAAFAVANAWHPGGWLVGAVVVIGIAMGILASVFKSKAKKKRELREKLKESIDQTIGNVDKKNSVAFKCYEKVEDLVRGVVSPVIDLAIDVQEKTCELCDESTFVLQSISQLAASGRIKMEKRIKEVCHE